MQLCRIVFPSIRDKGIQKRHLSVSAGDYHADHTIPVSSPMLAFEVPDGSEVHLELFNVDASGAKLDSLVYDFEAIENLPPIKPGDLKPQGGDLVSTVEEEDSAPGDEDDDDELSSLELMMQRADRE